MTRPDPCTPPRHRLCRVLIATAGFSIAPHSGMGQQIAAKPPQVSTQKKAQLEEVVVRAQKRSERIQNVPITVSAFNAAALKKANVTNVADLSTVVPGLVYEQAAGYALPYLRGIGTTSTGPGFENPVATYVDGVYYGTQAGALLDLNNIRSVEVDKGPQGTLFGRNSTGGAIQIDTLNPSKVFGGSLEAGYGNYDTYVGRAYVTGAVLPNLAANLAVNWDLQDLGYGKNLANGDPLDRSSDFSARNKFLYSLDESTRITLALDYDRSTSIPAQYPAPGTIPQFDPPISTNRRDAYGSPQPFQHTTQDGFGLTIVHDFDLATLTSITAVRDTMDYGLFDSTLTALPGTTFFVEQKERHTQASQEFQVVSGSNRTFGWVIGAFYYWERAGYNDPTTLGGSSFTTEGLPGGILQAPDSITDSGSVYGQGTYHITSTTSLILGARFTDEYKIYQFTQTIPSFGLVEAARQDKNFEEPTWSLTLQQQFAPAIMGYASYNRGFKSGGFTYNPLLPTFGLTPIKPEQIDALETGIKSELLDNRLRLNGSLFYYFYNNIQTTIYPDGSATTVNAPGAHLYGLDLDSEFIATRHLTLTGGLEFLHGEYSSFPQYYVSTPIPASRGGGTAYATTPSSVTGNALPRTPPITATIAANYTQPLPYGKVIANVTFNYDAGWYAEPDNRLKQDPYRILNLSLTFATNDDRSVLQLWAKNMLDDTYAVYLASQTNGDFVQYAPPRTYGFTITRRF